MANCFSRSSHEEKYYNEISLNALVQDVAFNFIAELLCSSTRSYIFLMVEHVFIDCNEYICGWRFKLGVAECSRNG